MGTRADFYIGIGENMIWIGSIAYNGSPDDVPENILNAKTREEYVAAVEMLLTSSEYSTFPKQGWPWPWKDSSTTDYAYAFADGKVLASYFGSQWSDPRSTDFENVETDVVYFPDMSDKQNIAFDGRSGITIGYVKRNR